MSDERFCRACEAKLPSNWQLPMCRDCYRHQTFVAIAEPVPFLPIDELLTRQVEESNVLYAGNDGDRAWEAMDYAAIQFQTAGTEHYHVYVLDNYQHQVSSISR